MAAPSRSGDPACGRPSVPSGDSRFTYFTSKQRFVTTRSSHLAWAILVSAWIVRANHCWEPTSLRADDGRVHGRCFRRRVASTSAKEWAQVFDNPSRPYQFAFGARAGTDAFAASARAALSLRPTAVVVSVDGRCAYASMSHIAFPSTLPVREVAPEIARASPFRAFFFRPPATARGNTFFFAPLIGRPDFVCARADEQQNACRRNAGSCGGCPDFGDSCNAA